MHHVIDLSTCQKRWTQAGLNLRVLVLAIIVVVGFEFICRLIKLRAGRQSWWDCAILCIGSSLKPLCLFSGLCRSCGR